LLLYLDRLSLSMLEHNEDPTLIWVIDEHKDNIYC
jgi:hypothetical protein